MVKKPEGLDTGQKNVLKNRPKVSKTKETGLTAQKDLQGHAAGSRYPAT